MAAFGHRVFEHVGEALADQGRDPDDLRALVTDDALADRVLTRLRERTTSDDEPVDPSNEDDDYGWYAFSPDDPQGSREGFRRARRQRAAKARWALLGRRPARVAGRRSRR
jgi:hypothetical protein